MGVWPDIDQRRRALQSALTKLKGFREGYHVAINWMEQHRQSLSRSVEQLYRDGQSFAVMEIGKIVREVIKPQEANPAGGSLECPVA